MWRTPVNKKSLHLYSNLESPRFFHSRCFSLLKGTRGGRFNFWKEWWRHRMSQRWEWAWSLSQMPSTQLTSCPRLPPCFLSNFPSSKWPQSSLHASLPLPTPPSHPMDELCFPVMATEQPVGGLCMRKVRGLPPFPLDIFVASLTASFIQCLGLPLSRAGSRVQLYVLLCSFKGGGIKEHHRSWPGAGKAGGTAYRYCQEPSESETPPRIWTR